MAAPRPWATFPRRAARRPPAEPAGAGAGAGAPAARDGEAVRARLHRARLAGRRRRLRISGPLLALGVPLVVAGAALFVLGGPRSEWWYLALYPGIVMQMLAILPTDRWAVLCARLLTLGVLCFVLAHEAAELPDELACARAACEPGVPRGVQLLDWTNQLLTCLVNLGLAAAVLRSLLLPRARQSTRSALAQLWRALGVWLLAVATLSLALETPLELARLRAGRSSRAALASVFAQCAVELALGAFALHPSGRVAVHAFLARRAEALSTAAGIAALLGGEEPGAVLAHAAASFRAISLGSLERAHLQSAAPSAALYELSQPARFQGVDAFVSHSWHDDAEDKWRVLQAWRADFRAREGREPLVWLDRACVHPARVRAQLASLPVYVGGCGALLVLWGPTYTRRLWCVLELFAFLAMGGRRVELCPLSAAVPLPGAAPFDAALCESADAEAAGRLLSVIEGASGTLPAFNESVRALLHRARVAHERRASVPLLGGAAGGEADGAADGEGAPWPTAGLADVEGGGGGGGGARVRVRELFGELRLPVPALTRLPSGRSASRTPSAPPSQAAAGSSSHASRGAARARAIAPATEATTGGGGGACDAAGDEPVAAGAPAVAQRQHDVQ